MRGTIQNVFQFGDLAFTPKFSLAAGIDLVIPVKRIVVAIVSSDADITDLQFQMLYDAVWGNCDAGSAQAAWAIRGSNAWTPAPFLVKSDGVSIRIRNGGAGVIADIVYAYIEVP